MSVCSVRSALPPLAAEDVGSRDRFAKLLRHALLVAALGCSHAVGAVERSVSRGAGASPATAHWAAVGHPTKVRSSPRASNSPPFRLILNYSCSDCLSCPLSGPVSCVCPVGASSRAHLVLPTSASTAAGSAGRPPGRSRSRQPRACFSPQVPACSDDRTRFFWLLFQLPSRGRRGAGGRGGAPRAPPPRRTVVRTCVRAAAPREEW